MSSLRTAVGSVVSALELSTLTGTGVPTAPPNSSPARRRTPSRTARAGSPSSHSQRPSPQATLYLLHKARSNIGRSNRAATAGDGALQRSPRPQAEAEWTSPRPPSRHTHSGELQELARAGANELLIRSNSPRPQAEASPRPSSRHSAELQKFARVLQEAKQEAKQGARAGANELALRTNRGPGRPLRLTPTLHAVPHTASSPRGGLQSEQRRRDPAGGKAVISAEIKGPGAEMLRRLEMRRDMPRDGADMSHMLRGVPTTVSDSPRRTAFAPPHSRTHSARVEPEPAETLGTGMLGAKGSTGAPVRPATVLHSASGLSPHAELALQARREVTSWRGKGRGAFGPTDVTGRRRDSTEGGAQPASPRLPESQSPEEYDATAVAGRSSRVTSYEHSVDVTSYRRQYLETKALGRPITPYGIGAHWGGSFDEPLWRRPKE